MRDCPRRGFRHAGSAWLAVLVCVVVPGAEPAIAQAPGTIDVVAAVTADGVDVLWVPHLEQWPRSWSVERLGPRGAEEIANGLTVGGDAEAMAALDTSGAAAVRDVAKRIAEGAVTGSAANAAAVVVGLKAALDPTFGRAVALRLVDRAAPRSGEVRYRVTAHAADGSVLGAGESPPLDPAVLTPPPQPPAALTAGQSREGVELYWPVPEDGAIPTIAYTIERVDAGGRVGLRTPRPLILPSNRDEENPAYLDPFAPVETRVTYRVASVDALARQGQWAETAVFVEDLDAIRPPDDLAAKGGTNTALVTWTPTDNANRRGYLLERAPMAGGPFSTVRPAPLPPDTSRFEDEGLEGGLSYFYRVRAVGPRDNLGPPTDPVMAVPRNGAPPPRVEGLAVETGRTRLILTWDAVPTRVAGYVVERQLGDADAWGRLDVTPSPDTRFEDLIGETNGATLRYRVVAIAHDNQASEPSDAVEATLPDVVPPAPPRITRASGRDGKAALVFVPSRGDEDIAAFRVLRSSAEDREGLVVGPALDGAARSVTDTAVQPGELYWYRLIAVDRTGNRSVASEPVSVVVSSPPLPAPPKPIAELVAEPFAHVKLGFVAPPTGLVVRAAAQSEGDDVWHLVPGVFDGTEALDVKPPCGATIRYRIMYVAADGSVGPPSQPVELQRPTEATPSPGP